MNTISIKSAALLIVAMLTVQGGHAQEGFFNLVDGWMNNFSIELSDSYTLFGLGSGNSPVNHYYIFNKIDLNGNPIDQFTYVVDSVETTTAYFGSQLGVVLEDQVYLATYIGDPSTYTMYGTLFRFDPTSEEVTLLNTYHEQPFTRSEGIVLKNDSSFLISGFYSDNSLFQATTLMETDLNGEPRWSFDSYCGYNCWATPHQILPLSNGNTAFLFKELDLNQPSFHSRSKAVIVVLDPQGEELWRAEPGDPENYRIWPGGMVEVDGEILVAYTDPYYYDEDGQGYLNYEGTIRFVRYALDGSIVSEFSFDGVIPNGNSTGEIDVLHSITQMQGLSDNSLLLSGYTGNEGLMLKMNTNGDINWLRHLYPSPPDVTPGVSQFTHILHTLPTSDGGFLCTGEFKSDPSIYYPNGIQSAFALKVDQYGCLEPGCEVSGLNEHEVVSLQVWPNPVHGTELNVQLPQGVTAQSLLLVDALGREVELAIPEHGDGVLHLSIEALPVGLYTLLVTGRDGELFSEKVVVE